jgi:hypothetical protein
MRVSLLTLILTLPLIGSVKAACPQGDLNRDCQVDLLDLHVLAEQWLAYPEGAADLNGDDEVNMDDLALLAEEWQRKGIPLAINELMASNTTNSWRPTAARSRIRRDSMTIGWRFITMVPMLLT